MKKKVLVTGGAGFQGTNLVNYILQQNEYEPIILTTYSNYKQLPDCKVIYGSVTDKSLVVGDLSDIDLIFHLACKVHVDDSINNPYIYTDTNIVGTQNILERARKTNIPVIVVSSCEVYGGCQHCQINIDNVGLCEYFISESCPLNPMSPYAASKAGQDRLAFSYYTTYDLPVTILRPFNVYGIGQRYDKKPAAVIPTFIYQALTNKDITIFGNGEQRREYIFADDLIKRYYTVLQIAMNNSNDIKTKGKTYNVGTDINVSVNELAEVIIKFTDSKSKIVHLQARCGEVFDFKSNSSLFNNTFGKHQETDFIDGLIQAIEFTKEYMKL